MKRNSILAFIFTLLALISTCTVLASPVVKRAPPPPPSKLFKLDNPEQDALFRIGQKVRVHALTAGGSNSEIYKKNPEVRLIVQTAIRLPDVNVEVAKVSYRALADKGIDFKVKKTHLSKNPKLAYRVRASFYLDGKHGYVDTARFHLAK
ncbi:hypothetical protein BGZ73_006734 [Actinomortierella ambigua]|nr:hypothetical protein BGZ73_006734 [Actinomortierella ambigua]